VSNLSHTVPTAIQQSAPSGAPPATPSPLPQEPDVLNDDVLIEVPPDRPCGTIRVKLAYEGRSIPIPADDPWAE